MHLPLDDAKIQHARELATRVVAPLIAYFDAHSTVAIERAVLRLYGVDGVDADEVPWPNRVVDRLRADGRLGRGAAFWLARARLTTGCDVGDAARAIADGTVDLDAADPPDAAVVAAARAEAGAALTALRTKRAHRHALKQELGLGPKPWNYLIVATGNIYEDLPQAVAAAHGGADIIAVIRSTGQSLLDYVPHGPTTFGTGGTFATGENFRLMREALDAEGRELGRYIQLTNYASGLCMPEITVLAAEHGLDMLLNDAMYGILFRDINVYRTLLDQHFSRRLNGACDIIINTGEDNYLTTADAVAQGHTVLASQLVNERFALEAGMAPALMGLGHAFEMNPDLEDGFLKELAMAQLVRQVFPQAPLKYMPPTKHITGNIFKAYAMNTLFNLVSVLTHQEIHLLGVLTEAIHTPYASDRYLALLNTQYVFRNARHLGDELVVRDEGRIVARARQVLDEAVELLEEVARDGLVAAIARGAFADVPRAPDGGKGLDGVFPRDPGYLNPFEEALDRRISA